MSPLIYRQTFMELKGFEEKNFSPFVRHREIVDPVPFESRTALFIRLPPDAAPVPCRFRPGLELLVGTPAARLLFVPSAFGPSPAGCRRCFGSPPALLNRLPSVHKNAGLSFYETSCKPLPSVGDCTSPDNYRRIFTKLKGFRKFFHVPGFKRTRINRPGGGSLGGKGHEHKKRELTLSAPASP
jgi:hypothetical protein